MARNAKMMLSKDLENTEVELNEFRDNESTLAHYRSSPNLVKISKIFEKEDKSLLKGTNLEHLHGPSTPQKTSSHFPRNIPPKARFGGGTIRLLQQRLLNSSAKTAQIEDNLKIPNGQNLQRFGSLQNLGNYHKLQQNSKEHFNLRKLKAALEARGFGSLSSVRHSELQDQLNEMQERISVESADAESRMNQYWAGTTTASTTTCF